MNTCLLLVGLFGVTLGSPSPFASVPDVAEGSLECQFPFIYKDIRYSTCTIKDDPDDKPWCSTKTDDKNNHIKDNYKNCTDKDLAKPYEALISQRSVGPLECQFPFIYNEVSYSSCTTIDDPDDMPWCSTKTDENNNHVKDNYRTCTQEDLEPPLVASNRQSSVECQFPFIYRGVKNSECIIEGDPDDKPWCSTKTTSQHMHIKGNWMYCISEPLKVSTEISVIQTPKEKSEKCKFPFIYQNDQYEACIVNNDPDSRLWCSTKTDNLNNHIKGNWKHCDSADTQGPLQADDRQNNLNCWNTPDAKQGECVLTKECPSFLKLLQQIQNGSAPHNGIQTLRNSVCLEDGDSVRVCCPFPENNLHTQIEENLVTTYSESQCGGAYNSDKIINGVDAKLTAWPWMVLFRGHYCQDCKGTCSSCKTKQDFSTWNCGGVLISKRFVLSAAHCFKDYNITFARFGEHDLSQNPDKAANIVAPQPQDINVERVIIHPDYGSKFKGMFCPKCNDIALVELAEPVVMYTRFVYPICLPSNPVRDMGFSVSEMQSKAAYAAGWGATDKKGHIPAEKLQQVTLTIQEKDFCRERKVKHPGDSILCAGEGDGRDTCRGDSGGPLMVADSFGLKYYAVGITSYGNTVCGADGSQGIFTNIYHYMNWIKLYV